MDHKKKLEFVERMTKMGLHHFDSGGGVIGFGNSNSGPLGGIAGVLTQQNSYNADAPTQAGQIGSQQQGLASLLANESAGGGPNPAQMQYQHNAQRIGQQQAALNSQNRALNPAVAAKLSSDSAVNSSQNAAQLAGAQQAQQQLAAQGQYNNLIGTEQQGLTSAQGINSQVSQNNANAVNNTQGGILSSLPLIGGLFAKGGSVQVPGQASFSNADNLPDMKKKSPASSLPGGGADAASSGDPFDPSAMMNGVPELTMPELGSSAGLAGAGAESGGAEAILPELLEAAPAAAVALAQGGPVSMVGKHLHKNMAKGGMLNENARGHIAQKNFAGPDRSYPIEDASHARNALARVSQNGSPALQSEVRGKVHAKYPGIELSKKNDKLMNAGGGVNAGSKKQKATTQGNNYANDKVPAMLSEGEIVIPRSITQSKMAPEKAAEFVRMTLAKKGMGMKK